MYVGLCCIYIHGHAHTRRIEQERTTERERKGKREEETINFNHKIVEINPQSVLRQSFFHYFQLMSFARVPSLTSAQISLSLYLEQHFFLMALQ